MKRSLAVQPFVGLQEWSSWDDRNCERCRSSGECDIEAELVEAYSPERRPELFGFISRRAGKRLAISGRISRVCGEFRR